MLPKMLHAGIMYPNSIYEGSGNRVGWGHNPQITAELVRRWNAFEAMGEALGALINSDDYDDDARPLMQACRNAYALYLRPDNNATLRGQNVDETA